VLDQAYACPQKVAERDYRRGPDGSTEDVVGGERSPGHMARAGDECREDRQVVVPPDQMQQVAQNRHVAAKVFMAQLTSTTKTISESSACLIIRIFTRQLKIAISVGLKTVLVLNARKM
jgi:hypothetical protein